MRKNSFGQKNGSWLDQLIERVRLRRIMSYIKFNDIVVDLGCGYNARLLVNIRSIIKRGIGIDLSTNGKLNTKKLSLINARVDSKLPIRSNTVNVVTALAIIEHVHNPSMMLKEAYRILRPGGMLIITTPSVMGKYPLELLAKMGLISKTEIADHKRYYWPATLRQELIMAGFTNSQMLIRIFGIGYLNIFGLVKK